MTNTALQILWVMIDQAEWDRLDVRYTHEPNHPVHRAASIVCEILRTAYIRAKAN